MNISVYLRAREKDPEQSGGLDSIPLFGFKPQDVARLAIESHAKCLKG
jgi:hypothetical protein